MANKGRLNKELDVIHKRDEDDRVRAKVASSDESQTNTVITSVY